MLVSYTNYQSKSFRLLVAVIICKIVFENMRALVIKDGGKWVVVVVVGRGGGLKLDISKWKVMSNY